MSTKPILLDETGQQIKAMLEEIKNALTAPPTAVEFVEQDLTDAQKQTARRNIGVLPAEYFAFTVQLPVSAWIEGEYSYTQTVAAEEVLADDLVSVAPAPAVYLEYGEAEVRCISQADGSLTFEAESLPVKNLAANIVIWRGAENDTE